MLYKKRLAKVMITVVACVTLNSTLVFATDEIESNNTSVVKVADEQNTKVTDAELASIDKILEYLNKEVKSIDEKIESTKTLSEYEKYPGVRLNIDTPYFGITAIVNSKLRIRDNVSTVDIANGYSIRNIISKKSIKIESFEVSNIVVITRDVKIDKDMTSADAQTCIFKLLDYLQQAKSVNKFVDKQLTSMIKPFFTKEKLEAIDNINDHIKEIDENLSYSLTELSYVSATTDNDVTASIDTLYKYRADIAAIKTKLKNVTISQTSLDETYDNIVKMNDSVKLFKFNVNKAYLDVTNNMDLSKTVYLINSNMANELKYVQDYLDNAKTEVVATSTETEQTTVDSTTLKTTDEKKYQENYKTSSEAIVQNMKKDMDKANEILDKVIKYNLAVSEQTPAAGVQTVAVEKLDVKATINELVQIYIRFLNKENVFLTENAKVNITAIKTLNSKKITSFNDIEYIYVNLSDILTGISDKFVSNSTISNVKTANSLKQVITKVISSSKNFKPVEEKLP